MSNFKYSLKTKEFSKRKHIFPKHESPVQPSQHALSQTPVPHLDDHLHDYLDDHLHEDQKEVQYEQPLREVVIIKGILMQNERKIVDIVDKVNMLYDSTTEMYEKHEKYLRRVVREKCECFTRMMRCLMGVVEKKEERIDFLDRKLSTFQNTVRSASDSLRITKIKQDCIEARIRNNEPNSSFHSHLESSFPQPLNQSHSSSFFLLNSPPFFSPLEQNPIQDQVSPFETNQYLLISSSLPKKEFSFDEKDNGYEKIRREVEGLGENVVGWLDQEGHLRRKNGSYILDGKGNVLECSKSDFERLMADNLIKGMKMKQK